MLSVLRWDVEISWAWKLLIDPIRAVRVCVLILLAWRLLTTSVEILAFKKKASFGVIFV